MASEGDSEGMVLSRLRSSLHWASAVRGSLLMAVLVLSLTLRDKPSSILVPSPPGSYANLLLSLVPKLLALYGWLLLLRLRLRLLPSLMTPMSSRGGLPLMLLLLLSALLSPCAVSPLMSLSGWLWLSLGTCACPDFMIGVALPSLTLEISACSCIWRLFGLSSVALMISGCMGDVAAIGEGGGGGSS